MGMTQINLTKSRMTLSEQMTPRMNFLALFVFFGAFDLYLTENILFLMVAPSKTHFVLNEPLIEELAKRGHQVTVVAPFKRDKPFPNVTEILVPDISKAIFEHFLIQDSDEGKFQTINFTTSSLLTPFSNRADFFMSTILNCNPMKEFLSTNQTVDMVVAESFMMEALLVGLALKFKARTALISPSMPYTFVKDSMCGTVKYGTAKDPFFSGIYVQLAERIDPACKNSLGEAFKNVYIPSQEKLMRKYFGYHSPGIEKVLANNSLIFVNHYFSVSYPKPKLPNMIEIGGYNIRPVKSLPKDIKKFLNNATEGVVYFNLEENLLREEFPKEWSQGILKAFSRLKEKVLWKFENDNPPDLPKNVKIFSEVSRSDVLAHPNIKLFISQGDILSLTDSVFRGVPVVGIYFHEDEGKNLNIVQNMGVGLKLYYANITEELFFDSIHEVLNNSEYTTKVKCVSATLRGHKMSPLETAVYWLEYAVKHQGPVKFQQEGNLCIALFRMGAVMIIIIAILTIIFRCIPNTNLAEQIKNAEIENGTLVQSENLGASLLLNDELSEEWEDQKADLELRQKADPEIFLNTGKKKIKSSKKKCTGEV